MMRIIVDPKAPGFVAYVALIQSYSGAGAEEIKKTMVLPCDSDADARRLADALRAAIRVYSLETVEPEAARESDACG